jgi:hypothetical protein
MRRACTTAGSALFLVDDRESGHVLQGWRYPPPLLDEPTVRSGYNPFTRTAIHYRSRLPPVRRPAVDAVLHSDLGALPWISLLDLSSRTTSSPCALCWSGGMRTRRGTNGVGSSMGRRIRTTCSFPFPPSSGRPSGLTADSLPSLAHQWASTSGEDSPLTAGIALELLGSIPHFLRRRSRQEGLLYWTSR